ncbi:hypothetical protein V9K67_14090 [Paraflavisolibacter sp. H34]|uniref:hypothetical protein n=1 Tax=Huijunlia imazamoxiresistens TaxID=3127457 RepID=UPI003018C8C5
MSVYFKKKPKTILHPKLLALLLLFGLANGASAQGKKDTTGLAWVDTSLYDEALLSDLDSFLDSLLTPRSFGLINLSAGSSVFNYTSASGRQLSENRQLLLLPSAGYFHKSGLGLSATASVVNDGGKLNPFQFSLTGSYDYVRNLAFITGFSASRYFTKDSLPFYTSPLKNELQAYFTYRKWWVRPGISASYGWGSKSQWSETANSISALRLRLKPLQPPTRVNTEESMTDFNVTISARHDFYWINLFSNKDYIRLSPQLSLTSGTQSFGFNQTSSTYGFQRLVGNNQPYRNESYYLDETTKFRPLYAGALLKSEWAVNKFFVQPQLLFNCYLPAADKKITTAFVVNTGLIF